MTGEGDAYAVRLEKIEVLERVIRFRFHLYSELSRYPIPPEGDETIDVYVKSPVGGLRVESLDALGKKALQEAEEEIKDMGLVSSF